MFLKDISVSIDKNTKLPKNRHHKEFNIGTHASAIAFQKALGNKYNIDNVKKINIWLFSPREKGHKYQLAYDVSIYHYSNFDFEAYFSMNKIEQEHYLLKVIKESLLDIARIIAGREKEIKEAYELVLHEKFPLDNSWIRQMEKKIE